MTRVVQAGAVGHQGWPKKGRRPRIIIMISLAVAVIHNNVTRRCVSRTLVASENRTRTRTRIIPNRRPLLHDDDLGKECRWNLTGTESFGRRRRRPHPTLRPRGLLPRAVVVLLLPPSSSSSLAADADIISTVDVSVPGLRIIIDRRDVHGELLGCHGVDPAVCIPRRRRWR